MSNTNPNTFNLAQLATWDEARECAHKLSDGPIVVGDGVLPETTNPNTSGIYIPAWFGGNGGFEQPNYADDKTGKAYFHLHYRFRNGAEGMNVGLILDRFRRYPSAPFYVLNSLLEEARSLARYH